MALKKFTDFIQKESISNTEPIKKIEVESKPDVISERKTIVKTEQRQKEQKNENNSNIQQIGKVIKFSDNIKPSKSYQFLVEKNISKDNTKYILSNQPNNSISIVKYDQNTKIDLSIFCSTLLEHYKKEEKLKTILEKIEITGTKDYCVISNLPDSKFREIVNSDIIKLLK